MSTTLAAISAIGTGVGIFGQLQQGKEREEQARFNARLAEEEAALILVGGELNEFRQRKQLGTAIGEQISGFAKAGVQFTGSPLNVIADSIANAELEIAIGKFNIEQEARLKGSEAEEFRFAGKQAKVLAQTRAFSTLLSAGSTTSSLSTGTKIGSKFETIGSHRGVRK